MQKLPKPTGEAPIWAIIRLRENKNVRVDGIMKVGMFKQALHKKVVFPLPECFMGMSLAREQFTYLVI